MAVLGYDVAGARSIGADSMRGSFVGHPITKDHRDFVAGSQSKRDGLSEKASHRA